MASKASCCSSFLQFGSDAVVADALDLGRKLYQLTKFRASEMRDAVMLKAMSVFSAYDGDDKGRGKRMRRQAVETYRILNETRVLRQVRDTARRKAMPRMGYVSRVVLDRCAQLPSRTSMGALRATLTLLVCFRR